MTDGRVRAARSAAAGFGRDLLDALLGRSCPGCGALPPRARPVCDRCDAMVARSGTALCLECMQGTEPAAAGPVGGGCPRHGAARLLLAGPHYEPPLDRIVHAFKYAGARELRRWIAALLPEPPGRDRPLWREYVIVAVPLHAARRSARGFDQARLLAEAAGAAWGIPVAAALARSRETAPQARCDAGARRDNVRAAFRLVPETAALIRGRPVLLVDDVATTGSTLLEAAAALEPARPSWILSLAAAHGGVPASSQAPTDERIAAARGL